MQVWPKRSSFKVKMPAWYHLCLSQVKQSCSSKCKCKSCDNNKKQTEIKPKTRRKRDNSEFITDLQSSSSFGYATQAGEVIDFGMSSTQYYLLEACLYVVSREEGTNLVELGVDFMTQKLLKHYDEVCRRAGDSKADWFTSAISLLPEEKLRIWVERKFKSVELIRQLKMNQTK